MLWELFQVTHVGVTGQGVGREHDSAEYLIYPWSIFLQITAPSLLQPLVILHTEAVDNFTDEGNSIFCQRQCFPRSNHYRLVCPQQLAQITRQQEAYSSWLEWHTNRCGVIINMDYKHISSPSLSGLGQRSVGRVLILILSANSVPATPQLGPLLSLTLPLSQNFYWSSDILTNIGNLIAALPRSSAFNIFAFLSALNWLKMFLHSTLLGWFFPPSEAERWKRDVKNIMFCTCQCWTSTAYVKWKFKFSILRPEQKSPSR